MAQGLLDISQIDRGLRQIAAGIAAGHLPETIAAVIASIERLHGPMQLAVLGKISSSKSTLVNAILGRDNLMATGQKEVTYNVGWLKYGSPDDDIVIHHKDGLPPRRCPRGDFERIVTGEYGKGNDNISYIEIHDDAGILRDINIIDTPGLDAVRGKDSQNTLDFIGKVKPDAVIMLFTHNVADNVLDVVRQFNAGNYFNPFNAMGVMAKIDVRWQESFPRTKTALEIGRKLAESRLKKDPSLRQSLFNLYPVSSLLFLAASTVDDSDIAAIVRWRGADPGLFERTLATVKTFVDSSGNLVADYNKRLGLIEKMGLYGVWLLNREIDRGTVSCAADARKLFMTESGADDVMNVIRNHFGSRSSLIKLESVYRDLQLALNRDRASGRDSALVSRVAQQFNDLFTPLFLSHHQLELLYKVYSGEISPDPEVAEEIRAVCGENGDAAPRLLGLHDGTCFADMMARVDERLTHWRREIALEPDPEEREWMDVVLRSYAALKPRMLEVKYALDTARSFLFNQ